MINIKPQMLIITKFHNSQMKLKKKIEDYKYFFISYCVGIVFMLIINNYTNFKFLDNNDISNWSTLTLEGMLFLPFAYYFAKHFFNKEKKDNDKKDRDVEKEKEFETIYWIKKIFRIISYANSSFYSLVQLDEINLSKPPSKISPNSLYSNVLDITEKQIHELYVLNPMYLPENIQSGIDAIHSLTEEYRKYYDSGSDKGNITQLWGNYLVVYGHFIAFEKLRDSIDITIHEDNFKKYNKIYGNDLTKICGLDKYWS